MANDLEAVNAIPIFKQFSFVSINSIFNSISCKINASSHSLKLIIFLIELPGAPYH